MKTDHQNLAAVMSSEEKGVSPAHKTSTPSHKSASSSSSSLRESKQVSQRILYCSLRSSFPFIVTVFISLLLKEKGENQQTQVLPVFVLIVLLINIDKVSCAPCYL